MYGFGGSAHLAAQVAIFEGTELHVLTRSQAARRMALDPGVASASDPADGPPEPWTRRSCSNSSGISCRSRSRRFRPAPVSARSPASRPTPRQDGEEFLGIAARIPIRVSTVPFALEEPDRAPRALKHGSWPAPDP